MKQILSYAIALVFIGVFFISCNDELSPTTSSDEQISSLNKVTVVEYSFPADLGSESPYTDCATGAPMQNHGLVEVFIQEKTTPSGNLIIKGWVDYNYYDGVTLENLFNGDIWTLTNGKNPFNEVIKENGFYKLSYQWSELYKLNKKTLHIHLKGHVKIEPDGTVKIDRESYNCF